MTKEKRLIIIGAGPAGCGAASAAAQEGIKTLWLDEQSSIGGRVQMPTDISAYRKGIIGKPSEEEVDFDVLSESGRIDYLPRSTVWDVTSDLNLNYSRDNKSYRVKADAIIVGCGGQPRSMSFPGWCLPGVMQATGAQSLLHRSGLIPEDGVILLGSGWGMYQLSRLYQQANVRIGAIVDTTPIGNLLPALRQMIRTGLWREQITSFKEALGIDARKYFAATGLQASKSGNQISLCFTSGLRKHRLQARNLFVHSGLVPDTQITRLLRLKHQWNSRQRFWQPDRAVDGSTSIPGLYVVGAAAGSVDADIAGIDGRIAGLAVAKLLARNDDRDFSYLIENAQAEKAALMQKIEIEEILFAPDHATLLPEDETIVCRCEGVKAGVFRKSVAIGYHGVNQSMAHCGVGMGNCQGRYCAMQIAEIIASERKIHLSEVHPMPIRAPIKPISLGELATISTTIKTS